MAAQYHTINPDLYDPADLITVGGLPVRVKRTTHLVYAHPKTYASHREWAEALGIPVDDVQRVSQRSRTHTLVFVKGTDNE